GDIECHTIQTHGGAEDTDRCPLEFDVQNGTGRLGQRRVGVQRGTAGGDIERKRDLDHEVSNHSVCRQSTSHDACRDNAVALCGEALDEQRSAEETTEIGDAGYWHDHTDAAVRGRLAVKSRTADEEREGDERDRSVRSAERHLHFSCCGELAWQRVTLAKAAQSVPSEGG